MTKAADVPGPIVLSVMVKQRLQFYSSLSVFVCVTTQRSCCFLHAKFYLRPLVSPLGNSGSRHEVCNLSGVAGLGPH